MGAEVVKPCHIRIQSNPCLPKLHAHELVERIDVLACAADDETFGGARNILFPMLKPLPDITRQHPPAPLHLLLLAQAKCAVEMQAFGEVQITTALADVFGDVAQGLPDPHPLRHTVRPPAALVGLWQGDALGEGWQGNAKKATK